MEPTAVTAHPLRMAMQAAIPLWIMELQADGGPTQEEIAAQQATSDELGAHGDNLLYRSTKPGETARLFNLTAKAVAILSYCPGGITFLTDHYETVRTNKFDSNVLGI